MKNWNRSLGKSKRELGIITPKQPVYTKFFEGEARAAIATFMLRGYDHLSGWAKSYYRYMQMSRAEKTVARVMNRFSYDI